MGGCPMPVLMGSANSLPSARFFGAVVQLLVPLPPMPPPVWMYVKGVHGAAPLAEHVLEALLIIPAASEALPGECEAIAIPPGTSTLMPGPPLPPAPHPVAPVVPPVTPPPIQSSV